MYLIYKINKLIDFNRSNMVKNTLGTIQKKQKRILQLNNFLYILDFVKRTHLRIEYITLLKYQNIFNNVNHIFHIPLLFLLNSIKIYYGKIRQDIHPNIHYYARPNHSDNSNKPSILHLSILYKVQYNSNKFYFPNFRKIQLGKNLNKTNHSRISFGPYKKDIGY
jgi:hypothetical protein